ncbi:hypothetical protein FRUB_06773 [Fimbriiglobus ruber]|uniref:Uncharacterized protein n=2 Tax=Fimbriiglobus ruber TaxID=1908690 RepID=A0A225D9K5_9BACT|nr:hypothetical protein FRUB_06773 [Fimbriiglobus ruber]
MMPLAIVGLVFVPDWATAFWYPRQVGCGTPVPVVVCPPVFIAPPCPPVYDVGPCCPSTLDYHPVPSATQPSSGNPPAAGRAAPTIHVEPEHAKPEPAKPEPVKPETVPLPKITPPSVPGRSALDGATETPAGGSEPAPRTAVAPESVPLAAPRAVGEPLAAEKPAAPVTAQTPTKPTIPPAGVPVAPVVPVVGKDATEPRLPPLNPKLPGLGDPSLPPLTIPTGSAEPPATSTSKSSPLADKRPIYDVVPVDGTPPTNPADARKVGFFNQSEKDVHLTVQGQSVTLPARHHVSATVSASFTWKLDNGPEQRTEVPTAAPGVEVIIRR